MNLNTPLVLAAALTGAASSFANPSTPAVAQHEHLVFEKIVTVMNFKNGPTVTWTLDPHGKNPPGPGSGPITYEVKINLPPGTDITKDAPVYSLATLGIQGIGSPIKITGLLSTAGKVEYAPSVYADASGSLPQYTTLDATVLATKPLDILPAGLNAAFHPNDNNIGVLRFSGALEFTLVVESAKPRNGSTIWDGTPHATGHDNIPPGAFPGAEN